MRITVYVKSADFMVKSMQSCIDMQATVCFDPGWLTRVAYQGGLRVWMALLYIGPDLVCYCVRNNNVMKLVCGCVRSIEFFLEDDEVR